MENTGRMCKASIAKESAWGMFLTPTIALSIEKENVGLKVKTEKDPRMVGSAFVSDLIKVGEEVSGAIDLSLHPEETGTVLNLALGKNAEPVTSPEAILLVYYNGTDPYAGLTLASGSLTGKSGASQAAAAQKFQFDLSNGSYDTVAELAAAITAVSGGDWKAYSLGYGLSLCTNFAAFSETQLCGGYLLFSNSASSTSKTHKITPSGGDDPHPSFSFCADRTFGTGKAVGYTGLKINTFNMKIDAQKHFTASVNVLGKAEETDKTYPSLSLLEDQAYTAARCRVFFGGYEFTIAKNFALNINNALDNSPVVGSDSIMEPLRQEASIDISGTLNLDVTERERDYPKYKNNQAAEALFYIENAGYADAANHVKYNILIRVPSVKLSQYDTFPSGPGRLTTAFAGQAVKNHYYDHMEVYVTDTQTGAY